MAKKRKAIRRKSHKTTHNWGSGDGKMAKLTPKIKAMEKKGMSIAAIAKKIRKSYAYTWVMARNYKYKA